MQCTDNLYTAGLLYKHVYKMHIQEFEHLFLYMHVENMY